MRNDTSREMNRSNHSDWSRRSAIDNETPLLTKERRSEDTDGNGTSIYRLLLKHHQHMLFPENSIPGENGRVDKCDWKVDSHKTKESSMDTGSSSGSSRSRSLPSLYPRISDESLEDDSSASISPFYREALEHAALVEEEELLLLWQHRENCSDPETVTGGKADTESRSKLEKQSSFYRSALEDAIGLEQDFQVGDESASKESDHGPMQRQSTICSFSSSSSSSCVDTLASISVDSEPVPDLFQAERCFSNLSISSCSERQDRTEMIAPNPCLRFLDDYNSEFSVTRSSAIPYTTGSVLFTTANEIETHTSRSGKKCTSMEKRDLLDLEQNPNDFEDDQDDEDLQMAIYLSRVESSAASSLNSEETRSASPSTKGSRSVPDGEGKNEGRSDPSQVSNNPINIDQEFLMSQFRAMEECQRNHPRANHSSRDTTTNATSTSSRKKQTQRRRSQLETRGATETRQAISNGDSHVVKCNGCSRRLQAPLHYSLVFCPKCQTVSPA